MQIYADVMQIDSSHNLFLNSGQPKAILKFICDEDFSAFSLISGTEFYCVDPCFYFKAPIFLKEGACAAPIL